MLLPIVLNSMNVVSKERIVNEILELNNESREFGLVLTPQEVIQLFEARSQTLQQLGRIELDTGVSKSIIRSFCSSPHIIAQEYPAVINELHEIFYYMKNETEDKIGDDELIRRMRDAFENSCGGSLELLKSKLTTFAEDLRKRTDLPGLAQKEG